MQPKMRDMEQGYYSIPNNIYVKLIEACKPDSVLFKLLLLGDWAF